ncbi:hypothetical protein HG531_009622 [Fusarium graminearum]|nr:hypothetical protein HG531_009622 [Fusarium graminearum]
MSKSDTTGRWSEIRTPSSKLFASTPKVWTVAVRHVRDARTRRRYGLVRPVIGLAVEITTDEHCRCLLVTSLPPLTGKLNEKFGAVLSGLYANVIEVGAEHNDTGGCYAVLELGHCNDTIEYCIPTARGLLRCLTQPAYFTADVLPDVVTVKDGRELAILRFGAPSTTDMLPFGAQVFLDLIDLMEETLLETNEGALVTSGDEVQLVDELGTSLSPGSFVLLKLFRCIADVKGDDAQGHSLCLGGDVHSQRCAGQDVELGHGGLSNEVITWESFGLELR